MAFVRPFIAKQDNLINSINEFIVVLCTFIFISIYANEDDDRGRYSVRAVIYIISSSGGVVCAIVLAFGAILIYDFVKAYLEKKRQEKRDKEDMAISIDSDEISSSLERISGFNIDIRIDVSNSQAARSYD